MAPHRPLPRPLVLLTALAGCALEPPGELEPTDLDDAELALAAPEPADELGAAALAATGTVDLTISAISPALQPVTHAGQSLPIAYTVSNVGTLKSDASRDGGFLSRDTTLGSIGNRPYVDDRKIFRVLRLGVDVGESKGVSGAVWIPEGYARQPGPIYLIVCADFLDGNSELSESNNCAAAGPTLIPGADLVVGAVSDPPATVARGDAFALDDVTANAGLVDAVATRTIFYLSTDAAYSDDDREVGKRALGPLAAGDADAGTIEVSLSPSFPAGEYFVVACADRTREVFEGFGEAWVDLEANNCAASSTTVTVAAP